MDFDRFIERVHLRARVTTAGAIGATRATLETVAERIGGDEARQLAAQLPREIAGYLQGKSPPRAERFSFGEFCQRVAIREASNVPDAISHARCVIETLEEAISRDTSGAILLMLHQDFAPLFYGPTSRLPQPQS